MLDGTNELLDFNTIVPSSQNQHQVVIKWGELCKKLGKTNENDECVNFSRKLSLGVSTDEENDTLEDQIDITISYTNPLLIDEIEYLEDIDCESDAGVCSASLIPGNKKVFINSLNLTQTNKTQYPTAPTNSFAEFYKIRFMYGPTLQEAHPSNKENDPINGFTDINITVSGNSIIPINNSINNLRNDQTYYFRLGSVDKAQNLYLITADNDDLKSTPLNFQGLLNSDQNCFIATATYGSSFNSKINTFRQFRNQFLSPHPFRSKNNFILLSLWILSFPLLSSVSYFKNFISCYFMASLALLFSCSPYRSFFFYNTPWSFSFFKCIFIEKKENV